MSFTVASSLNAPLLLANVWQYVFAILMFMTSLFLILLVLVQRGRGGGLAGAFGGMGGQSAFGTKAGDLFTKITMGTATFWIVLCILAIAVLNRQSSVFGTPAAPENGEPRLEAPTPAEEAEGGQALPPDSDAEPRPAGLEPTPAHEGAPESGDEAAGDTP